MLLQLRAFDTRREFENFSGIKAAIRVCYGGLPQKQIRDEYAREEERIIAQKCCNII